ncbi:hypothetical protein THAOC_27459 [Thalassiosira oceanica]|uniref:Uncharacterized protein n=1 Tax=Thalassiosira oceanica TaxID=159749 RepID=K0RIW6_THAOC|nr:hypothetical protein THAOC_27459 [Thalassiosira oceanica]|eukprot:EJK53160.1 hypothetical protein THAOC_27459 [Thalassiosira oceanica]
MLNPSSLYLFSCGIGALPNTELCVAAYFLEVLVLLGGSTSAFREKRPLTREFGHQHSQYSQHSQHSQQNGRAARSRPGTGLTGPATRGRWGTMHDGDRDCVTPSPERVGRRPDLESPEESTPPPIKT